jgi:hypothetical protein
MANDEMNQRAVQNFLNLSKVPDGIKFISTYDGDPKTLHQWISTMENVFAPMHGIQELEPYLPGWLQIVRNKIIGPANDALIARNLPLTIRNIKTVLVEYFGDQRDIASLAQAIPYLRQKNKTVTEFYHECNQLTADINSKLNFTNEFVGHVPAVMQFVNIMIRNAYVDGLNGDARKHVRSYRPDTLVEAFRAAKDLELADMRAAEVKKNYTAHAANNNNYYKKNFQERSKNPKQQSHFNKFQDSTPTQPGNKNLGPNSLQPMQGPSYKFQKDDSMRSRQNPSTPMSGISYQSKNNHLQFSKCDESDHEESEEIEEILDEDSEGPENVNFHLDALKIIQK